MTASESYDKALASAQQEIISQCGGGINVTSSSLYSISENEKGEVLDAFNESISLGLSGGYVTFTFIPFNLSLLKVVKSERRCQQKVR